MITAAFKSIFFRNVFVVMSGTALAQVIGYALMPLITRLYTPDDFGLFGTFNSVLGMLSAGVTLQYTQALMLPKRVTEAANLFAVSLLSVVLVTLVCAIYSVLLPEQCLNMLKAPGLNWLLWALPLALFVNGINQTLQAWCIRRKAFKRTSVSQVVRSLVALSAQVFLGFANSGGAGLVGGALIGDGAANINLARSVIKSDMHYFRRGVGWKRMMKMAAEYRDFLVYSTPQNILNAASQGVPIILLSHYYGITVAGYYALGVRVFQAPMNLLAIPLRQVLFQKLSEAYNQDAPLYPLFVKTTAGLLGIAALPAGIGFIWAPAFFSFIFGDNWLIAGEYSRWLILWLVPLFCNVPSILLARILRQQRNTFLLEIVILISRSSVLIVGGMYLDALSTVIIFSIIGAVINMSMITWIWILVKKYDHVRISVL